MKKYGFKNWAAHNAASSCAWNLQGYTAKPEGEAPEEPRDFGVLTLLLPVI